MLKRTSSAVVAGVIAFATLTIWFGQQSNAQRGGGELLYDQPPANGAAEHVAAAPQTADDPIVYVTRTGHKYHSAGCEYLRRSSIPMPLSEAIAAGYTPCSKCDPPVP